MTTNDSRKMRDDIDIELAAAFSALGCPAPYVAMRLIDSDPDPEPGPYFDVVVSARILVEHYRAMHPQPTSDNPVDR